MCGHDQRRIVAQRERNRYLASLRIDHHVRDGLGRYICNRGVEQLNVDNGVSRQRHALAIGDSARDFGATRLGQ